MYIRDAYGCEDVELRGFVSLMDLYEHNYIRLRKLIPDVNAVQRQCVSRVHGCMSLYLEVVERSRYTSTIRMTYHFADAEGVHAEPDLRVRIYHDAGLVEVMGGHLRHGREKLDILPADAKRQKWRLNRFLFKWLGYCLHLGHRFSPDAESRETVTRAAETPARLTGL